MKFFTPGSEGNIQDHAKTLNQDLINERNERYQAGRPIIFFAHSLGGLVVKNVRGFPSVSHLSDPKPYLPCRKVFLRF